MEDKRKLNKVKNTEFAAIYEIGRLIIDRNIVYKPIILNTIEFIRISFLL